MAPAEGPAGAGSREGRGGSTNRTRPVPPAPPPNWLEREPSLASAGLRAARRLARRSRATWPFWVGAALLLAGATTARRYLAPPRYEVTAILRVSEGTMDASGSNLSGGTLRSHVNELAFTSEHLRALLAKHPDWFPGLQADPVPVLEALREAMDVSIDDNGFIEDRGPGDPPRAARIAVSYKAHSPDAAWTIAHELADLLVGSTLEGQRAELEREAAAATETLRLAQDDLSKLVRADSTGTDPRIKAARERWRMAQVASTSASMALRAASAKQALRFELVDPGRKPEVQNDLEPLVTRFLTSLLAALMAGWLLAGAFDPRVVDADDIESAGLAVLGQLPLLPSRRGGASPSREGSRQRPRV
jgi:hypothetical protein